MSISSDVQKLEPGEKVRLLEVDGSAFGAGILRFHNETIAHTEAELAAAGGDENLLDPKSLWWQGVEYSAWPFQLEGLSFSSDGQSARPKLTVANIKGTIGALCRRFQGMARAKVTIHETFAHYLDARNFSQGNPDADPLEERKQVFMWIVSPAAMTKRWSLSFPALPTCAASRSRRVRSSRCAHGACGAGTRPVTAAPTQGKTDGSIKTVIRWMTRRWMSVPACFRPVASHDSAKTRSWILAGCRALPF